MENGYILMPTYVNYDNWSYITNSEILQMYRKYNEYMQYKLGN